MTIRPAEHFVHGVHGPIAIFDAEVCAILDRLPDVRRLRKEARGRNPRLDQALLALRLTGLAHTETSATGSKVAPVAEPRPRSSQQLNDDTVSTTTAAALLNITDRAVRQAITEKRLPAEKYDGRWRITRQDLHTSRR